MELSFYEREIESLQLAKSCFQQAVSFYQKYDGRHKEELVRCYSKMKKAECLNDLKVYFPSMHMQLEIILNSTLKDFIGIEKIITDLEKDIEVKDQSSVPLFENIFWWDEEKKQFAGYQKFKKERKISNLSFSNKVNLFYFYLVNVADYDVKERYHSPYNYYTTTKINEFRNKYSHGNFSTSNKAEIRMKKVLDQNKNNLDTFFITYQMCLTAYRNSFIELTKGEEALKI